MVEFLIIKLKIICLADYHHFNSVAVIILWCYGDFTADDACEFAYRKSQPDPS